MFYIDALQQVYLKHLQRQKGKWKDFEECGNTFLDEHDYKSFDLDILGKKFFISDDMSCFYIAREKKTTC